MRCSTSARVKLRCWVALAKRKVCADVVLMFLWLWITSKPRGRTKCEVYCRSSSESWARDGDASERLVVSPAAAGPCRGARCLRCQRVFPPPLKACVWENRERGVMRLAGRA